MSSQQSWAAWLLDSYASSISSMTMDSPDRHHDSPSTSDASYATSNAQSPLSSVSSSSAYGPYVRTGRGGAGNFTWQTELKSQKSSSGLDLEYQQAPQSSLSERREAAARLEHINTQDAVRMRHSSAQYLSVGRGGAGNYATVKEIDQAKRSPSLPLSLDSGRASSPRSPYPFHPGRGGAGNYAAAAEITGRSKTKIDEEEQRARDLRREQVVEEVDGLLQPPPEAWLGGTRRKSSVTYGVASG